VEVDRAVLRGRVAPAHLRPRPRRAHHGARREVDQLAVEPARSQVHRAGAGGLAAEVPRRHQVTAGGPVRRGADGRLGEREVVEGGTLDLAVVVAAHGRAAQRGDEQRGAAVQRRRGREGGGRVARVVRPHTGHERRLAHREPPRGRVIRGPHAVPRPGQERLADLDDLGGPAPVSDQGAGAAAVHEQGKAGAGLRVVARDDPLAAPLGRGRPDRRHDREALEPPERRRVRHAEVGAERHRLDAGRVAPGERRGNRLLLDPGSRGVRVARDHADQAGFVGRRDGARHFEGDRLAGGDGETVGVACDRKHDPPRGPDPASTRLWSAADPSRCSRPAVAVGGAVARAQGGFPRGAVAHRWAIRAVDAASAWRGGVRQRRQAASRSGKWATMALRASA
jgi:hypothetical protein